MNPRRTDTLITHLVWAIPIGVILMGLSRTFDGCGGFTGFSLVWLGASAGAFRDWREEPGLWMLSGFFLAQVFPVTMIFGYGLVEDVFRPAPASCPGYCRYDFSVATIPLAVHALLLANVTRGNWNLGRKPDKYTDIDDLC